MAGIRRGLNPKLRGFKGLGFGRALPAPFGFDNGFIPDGVNDYFTVPRLAGTYIPNELSIEFWIYGMATETYPCIFGNAEKGIVVGSQSAYTISCLGKWMQTGYPLVGLPFTADDELNYYCFNLSRDPITRNNSKGYHNGFGLAESTVTNASNSGAVSELGEDGNYGTPILISNFYIGGSSWEYGSGSPNTPLSQKMDEFRVYKKMLGQGHVISNYNAGVGNNPAETEHLLIWFKFEKFEMLDFSEEQDGSDMRLGIRDYSGNNYHGQPFNMVTNPADPYYVLKPFIK